MTNARLLDTNVLIHANQNPGYSPQTSLVCIDRCVDYVGQILYQKEPHTINIVLDTSFHILDEYKHYLSLENPRGSNRLGDLFLRGILQDPKLGRNVIWVNLTPTGTDSYHEWPEHPDLASFDPRDRKWIAAANAHQQQWNKPAIIMQSADEKWKGFTPIFEALRIQIDFICD